MVFLVDKKDQIIIQTSNVEEAKSIMSHFKESNIPISFEVIGASNKDKFKMIYPEYIDFRFIDTNDYSAEKKVENFFNKAMDNDVEFQKLTNREKKENENE